MLTEKQFLLNLALFKFNMQHGMDLKIDECDIFSIPKRFNADVSYEIYTTTRVDFVRLHIHLLIIDKDALHDYRVENDPYMSKNGTGNLFDELHVAMGTIDPYYKLNGIYSFKPISQSSSNVEIFLLEDDNEMLLEDGTSLLLETAN